jgi:membrane protein DedA with SNARE-associated domain
MFEWMRGLIESSGYLGLAFLMFLENVFPPIPSEFIMPLGGFVASQGKLNIAGVIIAGTVGSTLGALPLYYAGKVVGEERLKKWAEKHGRWLTVSPDEIANSKKWFDKHGSKAVIACRLVPGVRSLISIPAGIAGMNLPQFLLYTAIGSGVWAAILAGLGLWLGEKFENIERVLNPLSWVILGLIVAAWLYRVVKGTGDKKSGGEKNAEKDSERNDVHAANA